MSRVTKARKKPVAKQQPTAPPAENIDTPGLFSDTICSLDVSSTSCESIYQLLKEEGQRVTQIIFISKDSDLVSNTTYNDVENSFPHIIFSWPKLLP